MIRGFSPWHSYLIKDSAKSRRQISRYRQGTSLLPSRGRGWLTSQPNASLTRNNNSTSGYLYCGVSASTTSLIASNERKRAKRKRWSHEMIRLIRISEVIDSHHHHPIIIPSSSLSCHVCSITYHIMITFLFRAPLLCLIVKTIFGIFNSTI